MAFSKMALDALKPGARPYRRYEGDGTGFGVQVTPRGRKTFFQAYPCPTTGRRRFYSLGAYPTEIGLAAARDRAQQVRELAAAGIDPRDHDARMRQEAEEQAREEARKGTVEQLFASYVAGLQERGRTSWWEVERALRRDALPLLGADTKAREVRPGDIRDVLFAILQRGARAGSKTGNKVHANRVRSYLYSAFRHGIHHDHDPAKLGAEYLFGLETNPVDSVPRNPDAEVPGDRDLSWEELATLWHTEAVSLQLRWYFRLALATGGQRVVELVNARREEFDLAAGVWTIPAARTKSRTTRRQDHLVPLTGLAQEAVGGLCELQDSAFLFPGWRAADAPMSEFTVATNVRRIREAEGMAYWVAKDLRRTVKTRMGELGVGKWVRDKLQNHAQTDVSTRHYDRYDYLAEKREALERWDQALRTLARP